MKGTFSLLVGLTLLGCGSSTFAQTAPASPAKKPLVKSALRSTGAREPKGTAYVSPRATARDPRLEADEARLAQALQPTEEQFARLRARSRANPPAPWQGPADGEALNNESAAIQAAQQVVLARFIRASPQSPVSLTALNRYTRLGEALDPATAEPLFRGLAPGVRTSAPGRAFAQRLAAAKTTAVGALAPDFVQNDVHGRPVRLRDYRGRYVLVNFWASWCKPCRAENPNVVVNFHRYKTRRFTVLGVSLDRLASRDAWLTAIATDRLAWTHVSDLRFWQNAVAVRYGIRSVPQNVLIDPKGRIVAKNVRGENLGQTLDRLLPAATP